MVRTANMHRAWATSRSPNLAGTSSAYPQHPSQVAAIILRKVCYIQEEGKSAFNLSPDQRPSSPSLSYTHTPAGRKSQCAPYRDRQVRAQQLGLKKEDTKKESILTGLGTYTHKTGTGCSGKGKSRVKTNSGMKNDAHTGNLTQRLQHEVRGLPGHPMN